MRHSSQFWGSLSHSSCDNPTADTIKQWSTKAFTVWYCVLDWHSGQAGKDTNKCIYISIYIYALSDVTTDCHTSPIVVVCHLVVLQILFKSLYAPLCVAISYQIVFHVVTCSLIVPQIASHHPILPQTTPYDIMWYSASDYYALSHITFHYPVLSHTTQVDRDGGIDICIFVPWCVIRKFSPLWIHILHPAAFWRHPRQWGWSCLMRRRLSHMLSALEPQAVCWKATWAQMCIDVVGCTREGQTFSM